MVIVMIGSVEIGSLIEGYEIGRGCNVGIEFAYQQNFGGDITN